MKRLLMIPDVKNLEETLELAEKYSLGFEYNDFYMPAVLDDDQEMQRLVRGYQSAKLPEYCTLHGAFFDVIPFSVDERIKEVAFLRIEQSIKAAEQIGAKAVVFHTNYNPFLNSEAYIKSWIEQNTGFWSSILEKHAGMNIYLENMFDRTPDIMESLSEVLCRYENYGVCLDYAHAALSDVKPEIWAERLGQFVKHVHVNDNDLVSDLHLAWGDGRIYRTGFYKSYEQFMKHATVLIETSSMENTKKSLEVLEAEGFLKE